MSRAVARIAVVTIALAGSILPAQERVAKAAVYTGRLVDEQGRPIAGAGILVGSRHQLRTTDAWTRPVTTSDRDGRFRVEIPTTVRADYIDPVGFLIAARKHSSVLVHDIGNPYGLPPGPIDLRTVTLVDGVTIVGQVRDEAGKGLAGVRVTSKDLVCSRVMVENKTLTRIGFAVTDARGIFRLHCVPANYLQLTFRKPGYYLRRKHPVSKHTPLAVVLRKSGFVEGRLVDAEGKGVADRLWVSYEASLGPVQLAHTGADGRFRIGIQHQGRYSLRTPHLAGPSFSRARSRVLVGPQKGVLLRCAEVVDEPRQQRFLRAFNRRTGRPLKNFTARVFFGWSNKATAGELLRSSVGRLVVRSGGKTRVQLPPAPAGAYRGQVLVSAEGFAPKAVSLLGAAQKPGEPLNAFLETESAIKGRVVDSVTGKPIAGAQVWTVWLGVQSPQTAFRGPGVPPFHVRTDKDGRFRLGQLPPGYHALQVRAEGRPLAKSVNYRLLPGLTSTGTVVNLESGYTVQGQLSGKQLQALHVVEEHKRIYGGVDLSGGVIVGGHPWVHPVSADGRFQIDGMRSGKHQLVLVRPGSPRFARTCRFPLADLTVAGHVTRRFDIKALVPARLTGKIKIARQEPILDRLVVLAIPKVEKRGRGRGLRDTYNETLRLQDDTSASTVDLLGRYSLRLAPGTYHLAVWDADTGLELWRHDKPVEVTAGAELSRNLEVGFVWLQVELEYAVPELAQRAAQLQIRRVRDASTDRAWYRGLRPLQQLQLARRQGTGIPLDAGEKSVRWPVAPGSYDIDLMSSGALRGNHGAMRQASKRVKVQPGQQAMVRLRLRAPSGWKK